MLKWSDTDFEMLYDDKAARDNNLVYKFHSRYNTWWYYIIDDECQI